jgi:hypothetical protein
VHKTLTSLYRIAPGAHLTAPYCTHPAVPNAGNCADIEEQFASVPDTGLEDWRCPAFPDEVRARVRTVYCVLFTLKCELLRCPAFPDEARACVRTVCCELFFTL